MKQNRFLIILFILTATVVIIAVMGLKHFTEFKSENYLKPAIAKNDIIKIMTAVLIYEQEQGLLPSQEAFKELDKYEPETSIVYQVPPLIDPWGNPYLYSIPGTKPLPYTISCLGADNKKGGVGKDEDISSDSVYLKYKEQLSNSEDSSEE